MYENYAGTLQPMYFKCSIRKHPLTGNITGYYRLVESYRNTENRVCHHTILNVGFMEDTTVEQRNKIQKHLTDKYEKQQLLFEETDALVKKYVDELWQCVLDTKRLDLACVEKRARLIYADTIEHSNVREIGTESIFPIRRRTQYCVCLVSNQQIKNHPK